MEKSSKIQVPLLILEFKKKIFQKKYLKLNNNYLDKKMMLLFKHLDSL